MINFASALEEAVGKPVVETPPQEQPPTPPEQPATPPVTEDKEVDELPLTPTDEETPPTLPEVPPVVEEEEPLEDEVGFSLGDDDDSTPPAVETPPTSEFSDDRKEVYSGMEEMTKEDFESFKGVYEALKNGHTVEDYLSVIGKDYDKMDSTSLLMNDIRTQYPDKDEKFITAMFDRKHGTVGEEADELEKELHEAELDKSASSLRTDLKAQQELRKIDFKGDTSENIKATAEYNQRLDEERGRSTAEAKAMFEKYNGEYQINYSLNGEKESMKLAFAEELQQDVMDILEGKKSFLEDFTTADGKVDTKKLVEFKLKAELFETMGKRLVKMAGNKSVSTFKNQLKNPPKPTNGGNHSTGNSMSPSDMDAHNELVMGRNR